MAKKCIKFEVRRPGYPKGGFGRIKKAAKKIHEVATIFPMIIHTALKKSIFLLLCLFSLRCEALTLVDNEGKLVQPFVELLELFELPTDRSSLETAQIVRSKWIQEGKERWQYEYYFEELKEQAMPLMKRLGCVDAIHAQELHYDYAIVMGALLCRVERRLDFLWEEWQRGVRFETLVFLTGQRDIDSKQEPLPEGVDSETQMMIRVYRAHPLSQAAREVPLVIIDTSKQFDNVASLRRPNTSDTIKAWLKTHPQPGRCLAVSDQPFIGYQEAVVKQFLPSNFTLEFIGRADEEKFPLTLYLDNLAKWLLHSETNYENPIKTALRPNPEKNNPSN